MNNQEKKRSCDRTCCSRIDNLGVAVNGQIILHNVNLHLHCGELTILIGPNGGGKTTLLRAMIGEISHSGTISYHGVGKASTHRLTFGYVPQRFISDIGNTISVGDLFQITLSWKPAWLLHDKPCRKQALEGLEQMNAAHLIDRKLSVLSGGELQRVLVALAITPVPDILLLDEPVSGVDFAGLHLFYNAISELRQRYDLSIITVSHDFSLSSRFADRMVLLNKTIRCEGTPSEVLNHEQTRLFMGFGEITDKGESGGPIDHHQQ
jgi:zinc transport system ATP-binding protein